MKIFNNIYLLVFIIVVFFISTLYFTNYNNTYRKYIKRDIEYSKLKNTNDSLVKLLNKDIIKDNDSLLRIIKVQDSILYSRTNKLIKTKNETFNKNINTIKYWSDKRKDQFWTTELSKQDTIITNKIDLPR